MLENEIRHAAICKEINRAYKQGAGKEFHETFHGFRDRNDAIKMSRSLLGLNLDMFKKMSRIRDFEAARSALVALANQAMMVIIELDGKPTKRIIIGNSAGSCRSCIIERIWIMGTASICPFLRKGWQCPASGLATSICVSKLSLAARSSGFRMNRSGTRLSTWLTTAL